MSEYKVPISSKEIIPHDCILIRTTNGYNIFRCSQSSYIMNMKYEKENSKMYGWIDGEYIRQDNGLDYSGMD